MNKLTLLRLVAAFLLVAVWSGFSNGASAQGNKEFTVKERKEIINEVAFKHGIPPEILKAIALTESSMRQFEGDGVTPKISSDGGIGMMQVTLTDEEIRKKKIDMERLKYDTSYNVTIAA